MSGEPKGKIPIADAVREITRRALDQGNQSSGGEQEGKSMGDSRVAPISPSPGNIMRVTVQVGDRRFDEDLAAQAFIAPDLAGIDSALETGPARFAEWAMLAALQRTEHDEVKANIAVVDTEIKDREARVYLDVVASAAGGGGKAPTVDAIKALVQLDPERLALVKKRQDADAVLRACADGLRVLEVGREVMKDRKDYIIERARDARQEMQSRMSVPALSPEEAARFRPGGR